MGFPSLGNPVVLMTVKNATNTWYSSDFSHNDFSVWIEESHNDEMTICMKSIRAGIYRQPVNVTYAIFPTLCGEGYEYLDGKCYTKIAGLRSKRDQANTLCSLRQARLPIVENAAEANYLEMMSGADDTWIGYQEELIGDGKMRIAMLSKTSSARRNLMSTSWHALTTVKMERSALWESTR